MAKSPYIRDVLREQNLIEDLYAETINHMGRDVYYIPRTLRSQDKIFGEDSRSAFNRAYLIDMYLSNVQGFEGAGDIISKFGIEVKDRATLIVAKRTFEQLVTSRDSTITRPNEGDLIYFPMNKKLFEIQFVEHESLFYPTGTLPVYDLRCELFAYNQQEINTGIPEIDQIAQTSGDRGQAFANTFLDVARDDIDNFAIEQSSDSILDFSENNPFGSF